MRKSLLFAALALACVRAHGEGWSIGAGTGPFIFGGFAERSITIMNEGGTGTTRSRLSAATRPGAVVDLERDLGDRFAFGIQGTWTEAPLRIKSATGNQGVTLDAGHVRVTTFVAPVVLRINPRGTFRFHLLAGPAYALYNVRRRAAGGVTAPLFDGTRGRWGGAAIGALRARSSLRPHKSLLHRRCLAPLGINLKGEDPILSLSRAAKTARDLRRRSDRRASCAVVASAA